MARRGSPRIKMHCLGSVRSERVSVQSQVAVGGPGEARHEFRQGSESAAKSVPAQIESATFKDRADSIRTYSNPCAASQAALPLELSAALFVGEA